MAKHRIDQVAEEKHIHKYSLKTNYETPFEKSWFLDV